MVGRMKTTRTRRTRRTRSVKRTKTQCSKTQCSKTQCSKTQCYRTRVRKQRGGMVNFNSLSTANKRRAVIGFLDGGDVDSVRTLMSSDNADILTTD